ncbi:NADH dehydrogenase [ubiquinone] 1 beta subcomplex subunit 2, mitochondrial-like [Venturia canescens]|uniref:NADH dehydrogenase [ubiquinone] 1 beta subcomplex subunit 2, mitochondrial-like n=1 Tax=Venturia canescens TaxID=32260 RepID=UPI001C9CA993|nr:NADH dehydrogenase [ubiquinone] 1 beta subcomplex subunit 2, mitochondrial-like [Venturia canescens]
MLLSRAVPLFRKARQKFSAKKSVGNVLQRSSHGGGYFYREIPDPPKVDIIFAEIFGGIMWWWILWNCWHDFGHIVGEYDYPDPAKWTDEELGIPPED